MSGTMTIIRVNGDETVSGWTSSVSLRTLQKAVGGYIELVPDFKFYLGETAQAIVNEEGRVNGMQLNRNATDLCGFPIYGNMVILTGAARMT